MQTRTKVDLTDKNRVSNYESIRLQQVSTGFNTRAATILITNHLESTTFSTVQKALASGSGPGGRRFKPLAPTILAFEFPRTWLFFSTTVNKIADCETLQGLSNFSRYGLFSAGSSSGLAVRP